MDLAICKICKRLVYNHRTSHSNVKHQSNESVFRNDFLVKDFYIILFSDKEILPDEYSGMR